MTITWYGHACFRLESKDVKVLIDPFAKEIGLRAPRFVDNMFLVTHEHYDHNNLENVPSEAFVVRSPGEYEKSGVQIVGIQSFHDNAEGKERGLNTIFVVKIEEITFCHLGDLGQDKLTDAQIEDIGSVDVLAVPVGGTYTMDGKQAATVVSQLEPKIIIPMHYKVTGLAIDLDGPEKFIKEIGLTPEKVQNLKLAKKNLPTEETLLYQFTL